MPDYCISCKHCRTHIPTTKYYCKENRVERLPESTCIWITKKYPSRYEPQVPIHTDIQNEREKALDEKLASRYKAILMHCMGDIENIRREYEIAPKTCKKCSAYDLCEELRQEGKQ